jgi:hypothetical protein
MVILYPSWCFESIKEVYEKSLSKLKESIYSLDKNNILWLTYEKFIEDQEKLRSLRKNPNIGIETCDFSLHFDVSFIEEHNNKISLGYKKIEHSLRKENDKIIQIIYNGFSIYKNSILYFKFDDYKYKYDTIDFYPKSEKNEIMFHQFDSLIHLYYLPLEGKFKNY